MMTIMPPPPAATCLAFHLQDNNIVAIGMDNSIVLIYNVRLDEVKFVSIKDECMYCTVLNVITTCM